jgi:hypothetical protein
MSQTLRRTAPAVLAAALLALPGGTTPTLGRLPAGPAAKGEAGPAARPSPNLVLLFQVQRGEAEAARLLQPAGGPADPDLHPQPGPLGGAGLGAAPEEHLRVLGLLEHELALPPRPAGDPEVAQEVVLVR